MLQRLEIRNFRGFREFTADLAPVVAVLGPNSSGKTTVLHAIRLACELLRVALDAEQTAKIRDQEIVVANGLLIPDASRLTSLLDWEALFIDQVVRENTTVTLALTFDGAKDPIHRLVVEIVCARNRQLKLNVRCVAPAAQELVAAVPKKRSLINKTLTKHLRRHAPRAVFVPPFYGTVPVEEYRTRVVIDRLVGTGDQSHVVRNLIAGLDSERFKQLNAFLGDTLGAAITRRTHGDELQSQSPLRVYFRDVNVELELSRVLGRACDDSSLRYFRDVNVELELSAGGSGLTNLIALYASLSRWRQEGGEGTLVFLIDEPEAHLAPSLQATATSRLASATTEEFGAQLLLATHSVDILNRLSEDGALLLRCDRSATPSVTALPGHAALFDDLATWTDLTPYTAINFLASRRLLFCEGQTDKELLPLLARVYFRNKPQELAAFQRWAVVELAGSGNARLPELLSRLLENEAVRAGGGGPFRIEVILDRDYERTPGGHRREHHHETIWSRHSIESLFLDEVVLSGWVRAFVRSHRVDAEAMVREAIADADADTKLTEAAVRELQAYSIGKAQRDGENLAADHRRPLKEALAQAQETVHANKAAWHHGKDRARIVLGHIRQALPPAARAHFPTSIEKLLSHTDTSRLGDPIQAIPHELRDLLDRLVSPA